MKPNSDGKIDFTKSHPELYRATAEIKEIFADNGTFLAISGIGEPGGTAFQEAIGQLFALAYAAKFSLKNAGVLDFKVSTLECLWLDPEPGRIPRSQWRWKMLSRIPEPITATQLVQIKADILKKKQLDLAAVDRLSWREGRCLKVMHTGPYDKLGEVYGRLLAHASENGLSPNGAGHELYLSDPQRVAPERLKTIVRLPVKKKTGR